MRTTASNPKTRKISVRAELVEAPAGWAVYITGDVNRFSHAGWVRRSRNPTLYRRLRPLLGYDAARLTQPTQVTDSTKQALAVIFSHLLPGSLASIGVSL